MTQNKEALDLVDDLFALSLRHVNTKTIFVQFRDKISELRTALSKEPEVVSVKQFGRSIGLHPEDRAVAYMVMATYPNGVIVKEDKTNDEV